MLAPTTRDWVVLAVVYGVGFLIVVVGVGMLNTGGESRITGVIVLAHSLLVFPQTRPYILSLIESIGP